VLENFMRQAHIIPTFTINFEHRDRGLFGFALTAVLLAMTAATAQNRVGTTGIDNTGGERSTK
jgi:hypothetical protein